MRNSNFFVASLVLSLAIIGCKWGQFGQNGSAPSPNSTATPTPTPIGDIRGDPASKSNAYRIVGNIDDAEQEGNVCDTSKPFTVPGTLKFEFKPASPTKGEYTYSGPFNATGSGPYEIRSDGTMIVDGTGCIMGRCAEYSHKWKATPIDAATCRDGK